MCYAVEVRQAKGARMARTIDTGAQGFEELRTSEAFYVDKTAFIREWWRTLDQVTLVCRPRRFGKTLNLDTLRCFLSTEYVGRGEELFSGLDVWEGGTQAEREEMRALQGTVPVVFLSFADVKDPTYGEMQRHVCELVALLYEDYDYLLEWEGLRQSERARFERVRDDMDALTCTRALNHLCRMLLRCHGTKPVVLLDEYDAPMQQAWEHGFWGEASSFMRRLMNSTFKTNKALGRGLITGVTRVSRESIFSDLNNLEVVSTSSGKYRTCFGFTEAETFSALEEFGLGGERGDVQGWYDGYTFGGKGSIYNPWSVTKFLESGGHYDAYWANTSSGGLISSVVRRGRPRLKRDFEELMRGGIVEKVIDEQVVFSELDTRVDAAWALLLAAGYVTAPGPVPRNVVRTPRRLELTNLEVRETFDRMVAGWFEEAADDYDEFCAAILRGDARIATRCLAEVVLCCASSFDSGKRPSERSEPERFYHGLVLGMLARLRGRYAVESNRESGYGRYDVALVPMSGVSGSEPAVVIEFKVFDPDFEQTLEDTCARALDQIEDRRYVQGLVERGIRRERIYMYGMGFQGKEVLVRLG